MKRPSPPTSARRSSLRAARQRPPARALRCAAVLVCCALLTAIAIPAAADQPRDTLPFRIVYGRPPIAPGAGTYAYLWSQSGRLHLRIGPDKESHRVEGELRTSSEGRLEDVTPLSEDLRVRQPRPEKILFDVQTGASEEGLDVTLAGDFSQVTIDLTVDGERRPATLRIGERGRAPQGLPARLDLHNADSSWLARFGF